MKKKILIGLSIALIFIFSLIAYSVINGLVIAKITSGADLPTDLEFSTPDGWVRTRSIFGSEFSYFFVDGEQVIKIRGSFPSGYSEIPFGYAAPDGIQFISIDIDTNGKRTVSNRFIP
jgi:hypothetical protein